MEKASLQHEKAEDPTRPYGEDSATKSKSSKKKLFEAGSRAWLYIERVIPGLTKKIKKVDEFAFELELPDKSGYRLYPVVHISWLKPVNEFSSPPEVAEDSRIDFDEALFPKIHGNQTTLRESMK
ncbi:hypothetical protein PHMEG_00027611 [Phytophthora megakarya]|uniref:Reverse transcriptase n=1 Tax=Phytophthora megakarya TaxID=4795 RepID=A0A225V591_9STRA|nr:hypothetical protein PHMEG_00027611 [Phytophthora megakarya]